MVNRLRTGWLAGSAVLVLVLAVSGTAMAARVTSDTRGPNLHPLAERSGLDGDAAGVEIGDVRLCGALCGGARREDSELALAVVAVAELSAPAGDLAGVVAQGGWRDGSGDAGWSSGPAGPRGHALPPVV